MVNYKYYSWSVLMEDGTKVQYEFSIDDQAPWTSVLKRFGSFLEKTDYPGTAQKIEDLCVEFEEMLDSKLAADDALQDYFMNE